MTAIGWLRARGGYYRADEIAKALRTTVCDVLAELRQYGADDIETRTYDGIEQWRAVTAETRRRVRRAYVGRKRWNRASVLAAIAAWHQEHGRMPTTMEMDADAALPGRTTVRRYCG